MRKDFYHFAFEKPQLMPGSAVHILRAFCREKAWTTACFQMDKVKLPEVTLAVLWAQCGCVATSWHVLWHASQWHSACGTGSPGLGWQVPSRVLTEELSAGLPPMSPWAPNASSGLGPGTAESPQGPPGVEGWGRGGGLSR